MLTKVRKEAGSVSRTTTWAKPIKESLREGLKKKIQLKNDLSSRTVEKYYPNEEKKKEEKMHTYDDDDDDDDGGDDDDDDACVWQTKIYQ